MVAVTAGYRTIGDVPAAPPMPAEALPSDAPRTAADHFQAVARGAGAAAVGAKDAVTQLIVAPMPEFNPYTEPINPAAQLTLKDRAQLVMESCRPWSEFADVKAFNTPAAAEVKLRVGHNVETFFYNYLVVAFGLLAIHALFHPIRALLLAITVLVAMLVYIIFPEDYVVNDSFSITRGIKHACVAALALLVLTVGHVLSLLFIVAITILPLVLIHSFLREHSASVPSTI